MRDLPSSWTCARFDNILTRIIGGGTPSKANSTYFEGSIPFMTVKDLYGRFPSDTIDHISQEAIASSATTLIPADTLIVATRMALGKIVRPVVDVAINQDLKALLLVEDVNKTFVEHFWRSQVDYIQSLGTGTTVKGIRLEDIRNLEIPLAPLPEQTRIAEKLDAVLARVDACRDRLDHIPAILKRFHQSVLAAATSGALTEEWRAENNVIDDWQQVDVQTVAHVGTGSTPLRSNPAYFSAVGTPWITSAATSQTLVTTANEFVTSEAISAHRLKTYPVGTLLVAMYGEGKTRGQVTELGIPATINQACAAVVVDESKANRVYVKLALQANYFEMRELAEGGNQPNLNLSKVKEFPLSLPELAEQTEIIRRVETLFAFADRLDARCKAARSQVEKLSPSLLAKAFRGELVPQDPNDEPASVVLERIRTLRIKASAGPKPRVRRVGTSINKVPMLSQDKNASDSLTSILRRSKGRTLDAKALWQESQLSISDFYEKLKAEADSGLLREIKTDDRSFLEAV